MDLTDEETRAIYASLRLKELVLQELVVDGHRHVRLLQKLREKFEQEIISDTKKG